MEGLVAVRTGFSSAIDRTAHGACLRVARTGDAGRMQQREAAVMAVLTEHVGVEVPWPAEYLPPARDHPYGAFKGPWLDGAMVDARVSPRSVVAFLNRLHAIDVRLVAPLVEPYDHWCGRQSESVDAGLGAVADFVPAETLGRIRSFASAVAPTVERAVPTIVHGDLWHGNMVMREHRLTGVLDWEFAGIGDPAADLAGLWYLGEPFAREVCTDVGWSGVAGERIQYFRLVRELYGAAWSVRHGDTAELGESVRKLRRVVADMRPA